jgi:integration host factor subunit beta
MTRFELINIIQTKLKDRTKKDINSQVRAIFEMISDHLTHGKAVEIRGFGRFSLRNKKSRILVNPKTQNVMQVPERKLPFFKAGKYVSRFVNKEIF